MLTNPSMNPSENESRAADDTSADGQCSGFALLLYSFGRFYAAVAGNRFADMFDQVRGIVRHG